MKISNSEKRFREFVEFLPEMIFETDLEGNIIFVNNAAIETLGYSKADYKKGINSSQLLIPEEIQRHRKLFANRINGGKIGINEYTVRGKDGNTFPVLVHSTTITDDADNIIGTRAIVMNISERKQAEAALRESEERHRSYFKNSIMGIYQTTPQGEILSANPALLRMLGYSSLEELKTRNLEKEGYEPGYERSIFKKAMEENGKVVGLEAVWTRKDGSVVFVRENAIAKKDDENNVLYYEGTVENITERMQADEALRKSEQQLSVIYDSIGDVLYYMAVEPDDCFRFLSINQSFLDVTGLTEEQIVGKRIEEVIPEPSVWMVRDNYKKAIEENRIVRWEETSEYPTGVKIGEVSIAPIFDDNGICTHLIGSVHDITERKQAEMLLKKNETELRELSAKLIHVQEEDRKQLSRELHDELGQALTAIHLDVSFLERNCPADVPAIIKDRLTEIGRITDSMIKQLRQMTLDLRPAMLDDLGLEPTLQWYMDMFRHRTNTNVILDIKGLEERLPADMEVSFYRIIQEALTNTAKYADASRVTITITKKHSYIKIMVTDNGKGFDYKAYSERKQKDHGAGLLGIRERINILNGRFAIETQLGKGTKLKIKIPLKEKT